MRVTTNSMLSVAEAQAMVLERSQPLPPRSLPITSALDAILAEDVQSDIDMPPFDKAMMDGYAVRAADLTQGGAVLEVIEEITAGQTPEKTISRAQAARIMTGAPVPSGANAVVKVEESESLDGGRRVHIRISVQAGKDIQPKARELRAGEAVLAKGALLRPQEIGLLATVGRTNVLVFPKPEVAIVSTGDELVEAESLPRGGQIRNSNGPMLEAQVSRAGATPRPLGIARDRLDELRERIAAGLQSPMLILSGGVSAGKLDLVPGVLTELGVRAHFHKVAMKPGKPVFFGSTEKTLVFGLPGNPVSAFVAFELFVRLAIDRLMGRDAGRDRFVPMPLAEEFFFDADRPTYHPAKIDNGLVKPVTWHGSPDLRALTLANALVLLPPGIRKHPASAWLSTLKLN